MQIQLTEAQAQRLRRMARHRGVSAAALVREALDRALGAPDASEEAWQRAIAAMGRFEGPGGSVATDHDDWFAEAVEAQDR
jgi:hypothetical protein